MENEKMESVKKTEDGKKMEKKTDNKVMNHAEEEKGEQKCALTELVMILDRSGSMHGLEKDTVGGFNSVIDEQRQKEGELLVSAVLFNTENEVIYDRVPIGRVEEMTEKVYRTGGGTALMDALGGAIHHIGNVHKYARPEDRPEHTIFVITTDGYENASRLYSADRVREMVKRQREKYGWEFLFLGANIDAVETAEMYGIDALHASNYVSDGEGTRLQFKSVARAVASMRMDCCIAPDWKEELEKDVKKRG